MLLQIKHACNKACFVFINQLFNFMNQLFNERNPVHYLQRSAIEHEVIVIDNDTKEMLEAINFKDLPGISVQPVIAQRS
jgi:hypothetical protein